MPNAGGHRVRLISNIGACGGVAREAEDVVRVWFSRALTGWLAHTRCAILQLPLRLRAMLGVLWVASVFRKGMVTLSIVIHHAGGKYAWFAIAVAVVSLFLAEPATAQVPPATYLENVNGTTWTSAGVLQEQPCTGNAITGTICTSGLAEADGALAHVGGQVTVTSLVSGIPIAANASVGYYFEVAGAASISVPLLITATVTTSVGASPNFVGSANAQVAVGGGPTILGCSATGNVLCAPGINASRR